VAVKTTLVRADEFSVELEPSAVVLVESTRHDDVPSLRRARVTALADGLVGLVMEDGELTDLVVAPGRSIGLSAPGRFGVVPASIVGVDRHRNALIVETETVVVPLRDRRRHPRATARVEVAWNGGAASASDVSPGGILVRGMGPNAPTSVAIAVGTSVVVADAQPIERGEQRSRLRFVMPVAELDAGRVVRALTLGN
jgi:hypothetical protein